MTLLPTLFGSQAQGELPRHEQRVRSLQEAMSGWRGHLPQHGGGQP